MPSCFNKAKAVSSCCRKVNDWRPGNRYSTTGWAVLWSEKPVSRRSRFMPVLRSSVIQTSCHAPSNRLVRCRPTKPQPPVRRVQSGFHFYFKNGPIIHRRPSARNSQYYPANTTPYVIHQSPACLHRCCKLASNIGSQVSWATPAVANEKARILDSGKTSKYTTDELWPLNLAIALWAGR
jgi:hypothetical protein